MAAQRSGSADGVSPRPAGGRRASRYTSRRPEKSVSVNKAVLSSLLLSFQQPHRLPQTFIFFVTSRCNARCQFCLYYEQITNPVAKREELTVAEVEEIARRYGRLHYLALSRSEEHTSEL